MCFKSLHFGQGKIKRVKKKIQQQQQQNNKKGKDGTAFSFKTRQVLAFSPTSPELPGFSTMALNAHACTNSLRTVCVYKECKSIFKCLQRQQRARRDPPPSSVNRKPHSLGVPLCLSSVAAASSTWFHFIMKGAVSGLWVKQNSFKI